MKINPWLRVAFAWCIVLFIVMMAELFGLKINVPGDDTISKVLSLAVCALALDFALWALVKYIKLVWES